MLLLPETPTLSTFFAGNVGQTSLLDNNQLPDCAIKSLTSPRQARQAMTSYSMSLGVFYTLKVS